MAREFYPGLLVECMDVENAPQLERGKVYRVKRVKTGRKLDRCGNPCDFGVFLVEVQCDPDMDGFSPHRFKPLPRARLADFDRLLQGITLRA